MMAIEMTGAMTCLAPWVTSKARLMHTLGLFWKATPFLSFQPFSSTSLMVHDFIVVVLPSELSYSYSNVPVPLIFSTHCCCEVQASSSQHHVLEGWCALTLTISPDQPRYRCRPQTFQPFVMHIEKLMLEAV